MTYLRTNVLLILVYFLLTLQLHQLISNNEPVHCSEKAELFEIKVHISMFFRI